MIRSRIAPTPSGYLHLGNAVNFLLTWLAVKSGGGVLKLRIDDADGDRSRPEFVEDIFRQLDWLGISWDEGPSGPDDFYASYSQRLKTDRYRLLLDGLGERAHLFACQCSRQEIRQNSGNGLYPGTCRSRRQPAASGQAVRVHVPPSTHVPAGGQLIALCETMGDFVLWRKDDQPAYQLTSLADDIDDRINLVVRGEDLLESTAAQLFMAERLGADGFLVAAFHHHPLITGEQGEKLSKSRGSLALQCMRESGSRPAAVYRTVARLLGLDCSGIDTLDQLLGAFDAAGRSLVFQSERGDALK